MNKWNLGGSLADFFAAGFKDGDLVTHTYLEGALCLPPADSADDTRVWALTFMDRFEQLKDVLLREHRIYLSNVRGKGWVIVPPDEQAHVALLTAMNDIKRAASKCNKALEYARVEQMSETARRRHTDAQVKLAGMRAMFGKQKTDIFALFDRKGLEHKS